jgi:predicted metal-dependent hydrolase
MSVHAMNAISDGSFDPDFGKTLSFYADKGLHGYYSPGESWEVYLNVKEIRSAGIYDEIYAHEHMHHQLMCSSAFGHAQQIVARLARRREGFKILEQALMQLSWAVHEGAAMLAGFHAHCAGSATSKELQALTETPGYTGSAAGQIQLKLEREYLSHYHQSYEAPFLYYSALRNTLFPPNHYASVTSVFANAVGQFALNTDILPRLSAHLSGERSLSSEYFNAVNNHPGKRARLWAARRDVC